MKMTDQGAGIFTFEDNKIKLLIEMRFTNFFLYILSFFPFAIFLEQVNSTVLPEILEVR